MTKTNRTNQVSKQARTEQRRAHAEKQKMWRKILWIVGATILLIVIILAFATRPPLPGESVKVMSDQSHISDASSPHDQYNSDPPTSGQHVTYSAPWGIHKEPLDNEVLVHNLEDGGIVIYYNKQIDEITISNLETIVEKYPESVIVNPYPEMKNAITLTAWGRIDRLDSFEQKRIVDFISAFKGKDHH
ncbi:hypothetical protein BK120_23600 [Paenibacillus sp. FSL A5-0031]|uniref:DUF3105 domain-containing protein n=1 Tax=Paenibacillus sp. FSL A5-0031 TaxID=1920420 RepID=UPI00096D0169|nr:DUF3105 domain-containing protein [Paenibacillus sp. FSL A5-0031]OME78720.1 hypothetical protein BK120_23600 [Paenibacillus sp. FSL A5-0031]